MKKLRNPVATAALCIGAGIVAMLLRMWLLATGVDEKGLLRIHAGGILSWVVIIAAVAAVGFAVFSHRHSLIFSREPWWATASVSAAAGYIACVLWLSATEKHTFTFVAMAAGIAASLCCCIIAIVRSQKRKPALALHFPGIAFFIFLLLHEYQQWSAETQLHNYAFQLLALLCTMLAFYQRAALEHRIGKWRQYLFFSRCGILLCLAAVPGSNCGMFYICMALSLALDGCQPKPHKKPLTMFLPNHILSCINALEEAGFAAYAVGGCVRDALLGLTPQDYDLCTDATPDQIKAVFAGHQLVLAGEKHGTVTVMKEEKPVEITTFRTEGSYGDSRHPDWVRYVSTIEEDLSRRDFTVNAMAYSPTRGFADPFDGKTDLQNKVLRAVGDPTARFTEDALRILRGVRFAVRYDLTVEQTTLEEMFACRGHMDRLAVERIFDELCKLLPLAATEDILRFSPVLLQVIPELQPTVGFDQHSVHHQYDVFTHTAHVVGACPADLPVRLAALLHDAGKPATFSLDEEDHGHFYDHATVSAQLAEDVLLRLKAPTALRKQVVTLVKLHMTPLIPDKRILRRRLAQLGKETVQQLLSLQKADFSNLWTDKETETFHRIATLLEQIEQEDSCLRIKDLAIDGSDLIALGYEPGPELGRCLEALLEQVLDEQLPNEKDALLGAAKKGLMSQ